jgi:hypothetical protein
MPHQQQEREKDGVERMANCFLALLNVTFAGSDDDTI